MSNRFDSEKNASKFPAFKSMAEQILANAQDSRPVVQDFVPLAQSLEWELGQQYLKDRGNKAFISDASPVPFVVNNDGNLSRSAAEVLFASLVEDGAWGHSGYFSHATPMYVAWGHTGVSTGKPCMSPSLSQAENEWDLFFDLE